MKLKFFILFVFYVNNTFATEYDKFYPPTFLYHWTSLSGLKKMSAKTTNGIPLKFIVPQSVSLKWFSDFFDRKNIGGLYAFHNTTAVAGGFREDYGNVLVRLKIDTSKVRLFRAPANEAEFDEIMKSDSALQLAHTANVIYFPFYNEWVLLDPAIILEMTADPLELSSEVKMELTRLKSKYIYKLKDLHYPYEMNNSPFVFKFRKGKSSNLQSRNRRNYTIFILEKFLSIPREILPIKYLSYELTDLDAKATSSAWLKSQKANLDHEELSAYADPYLLDAILELQQITKDKVLLRILDLGTSKKAHSEFDMSLLNNKLSSTRIKKNILLDIANELLNPNKKLYNLFEKFFDIESSSLLTKIYEESQESNKYVGCRSFLNQL